MKPVRVEYVTPGAYFDDEYQAAPPAMPLARRAPSFVAPEPKRAAPAVIDVPAWLTQAQPVDVAPAWAAVEGAQERTSAMDRAQALRVRLLPFVGLWALLGVIVGGVVLYVAQNAPGAALVALLTFTALTSGTYVKLNGQDYAHSREGTERLRVTTAGDLAKLQLQQNHELRRAALDAYLKTLERGTQE